MASNIEKIISYFWTTYDIALQVGYSSSDENICINENQSFSNSNLTGIENLQLRVKVRGNNDTSAYINCKAKIEDLSKKLKECVEVINPRMLSLGKENNSWVMVYNFDTTRGGI